MLLGTILRKTYVEALIAAVSVLFCVLAFRQALSYQGETGLLPRAVLLIALVLTSIWLVKTLWRCRSDTSDPVVPTPLLLMRVTVLICAAAVFLFGFEFVGFYTTSAIVVPATAWGLGYRHKTGLLIGTVLFVLLLIGVFNWLLKVPLPAELLFSMQRNGYG